MFSECFLNAAKSNRAIEVPTKALVISRVCV